MNNYKIPAPYSKSGGKVYTTIVLCSFKFDVKTGRTNRASKIVAIRLDKRLNLKQLKKTIEDALEDWNFLHG